MSTLDTGLTFIRNASQRVSAANGWMGNAFKGWMPTGLYARALLIMIVPMVVLQTVVAFVFMERHWNTVTRRLSAAVVQDIASLIDVYKAFPQDKDRAQLRRIGQRLQLVVDFLPVGDMPQPVLARTQLKNLPKRALSWAEAGYLGPARLEQLYYEQT
jgi:two-component system osmolarity sensor histidine kinase EnvZ